MIKYDVYLKISLEFAEDERSMLIRSFDSDEVAIAFIQSIKQSVMSWCCGELHYPQPKPDHQYNCLDPFFIIKTEED